MSLKNRTPLSTLRDQRRRAELQKSPKQVTATQLRGRALDSLRNGRPVEGKDRQKNQELLDRLRQALQDDASQNDASKEYSSLQDELVRVNQRQMAAQEPDLEPQDLAMDSYRPSTQPFTLVLVPGADDMGFSKRIRRLDSLLNNFDSYRPALPAPEANPSARVLSLAPETVSAPEVQKDHSDHAADLVQETMQAGPASGPNVRSALAEKADMRIPASLALSLLND